MNQYRRMLEEGFKETRDQRELTRLEYLTDEIFNFTTYDSEMSEHFARKALEVCAAISDRKTFEYIEDLGDYSWFLIMVNMPFFASRLNWGTSVRGAYWDPRTFELSSCGLWLDGKQLTEPLKFTPPQWLEFIAAVLDFAGDADHNPSNPAALASVSTWLRVRAEPS